MDAYDRCDKCGAQALTRVRSVYSLKELLFCGHHTNEYMPKLDADGFYVVSRRPAVPPQAQEVEPA